MLVNNTPVETYQIDGQDVLVKREDLCCTDGPPFSKVRGALEHLKKLKQQGVTTVGYCETSISQAGWCVAWLCKELSLTAVIFDPQYKQPCETLTYHRTQWAKYNAVIRPIKAGMAKVNWYICKKLLKEEFGPTAVLLPLGIPFEETIQATEAEVIQTLNKLSDINSFVICVGSGTITAGLWRGVTKFGNYTAIYGIMGRTGNIPYKMKVIATKARLSNVGLYKSPVQLILKDPGWEYTEESKAECPFPCNKYYDRKSWQWLTENINLLKKPILFWNIGS
jgi:1-aminocyclopropane-1-carboxylate deaminase/D-cysteine desulfhydrase-like pyridoxal-dependent ACC family enzyme